MRYDIYLSTSNVDNFGMYKSTIFDIINRHVPIRKKYIRVNEAPFMSKELHKALMRRSRLRNTFFFSISTSTHVVIYLRTKKIYI